jgi:hypothetical protein
MKTTFKNIYAVLLLPIVFLFTTSCVEDQIDRTFNGNEVVEFKNQYLERQSAMGAGNFSLAYPYVIVGENSSLISVSVREQAATFRDSILVQLVGSIRPQDVEIDYVVDAASTAVNGVSYNIVDRGPTGKIVIPAGSLSGYLVFDVFNGLTPADPARVSIVFTLLGAQGVAPSTNYSTFTYTIVNN